MKRREIFLFSKHILSFDFIGLVCGKTKAIPNTSKTIDMINEISSRSAQAKWFLACILNTGWLVLCPMLAVAALPLALTWLASTVAATIIFFPFAFLFNLIQMAWLMKIGTTREELLKAIFLQTVFGPLYFFEAFVRKVLAFLLVIPFTLTFIIGSAVGFLFALAGGIFTGWGELLYRDGSYHVDVITCKPKSIDGFESEGQLISIETNKVDSFNNQDANLLRFGRQPLHEKENDLIQFMYKYCEYICKGWLGFFTKKNQHKSQEYKTTLIDEIHLNHDSIFDKPAKSIVNFFIPEGLHNLVDGDNQYLIGERLIDRVTDCSVIMTKTGAEKFLEYHTLNTLATFCYKRGEDNLEKIFSNGDKKEKRLLQEEIIVHLEKETGIRRALPYRLNPLGLK